MHDDDEPSGPVRPNFGGPRSGGPGAGAERPSPGAANRLGRSLRPAVGVRGDRRPRPPLRGGAARVLDRRDLVQERRLRCRLLDPHRRRRGAVRRRGRAGPGRLPRQPLARPASRAAAGGRPRHVPGPVRAAGRVQPRGPGRPVQPAERPAPRGAGRAGGHPGPDPDRVDRPGRPVGLRGDRHRGGGGDRLADRPPVDQPGAVRRRRRDGDRSTRSSAATSRGSCSTCPSSGRSSRSSTRSWSAA